jgi:uncharacterized protein involved in exopolysaccharide biosynthesis
LLDERAVTSQVEILRSTDLVKQVARTLDLSSREEFDPAAISLGASAIFWSCSVSRKIRSTSPPRSVSEGILQEA